MTILERDFEFIERQMLDGLSQIRHRFNHAGDKGSNAEATVREFLEQHLPRRLSLGHGEIIDSKGNRSRQTDVIITNEDHPFNFSKEKPGLFFIEGVSAVGEVKSVLTADELEKTIISSRQFRSLELEIGVGSQAFANPSDAERFYKHPPYFLFAFESKISLQKVKDVLDQNSSETELNKVGIIDHVIILGRGNVTNYGDGQGSLKFLDSNSISIPGWVLVDSPNSLFRFFGWLSAVMPKIVRYQSLLLPYLMQIKNK